MIKVISIVCVLFLLVNCGNSKLSQRKVMKKVLPVVLTNDFSSYARSNAETQILNAVVSDSTLTLKVSYSGGCEVHAFELIGFKIMEKSKPPVRGVMLFHDSKNDDCRALVEQELRFNVSDFTYVNGKVLLDIEGWKPRIELVSKR